MPQVEQESTSQLVRRLYEEGSRLARTEVELARRDVAGYMKHASMSLVLFGLSGVLLFGSFVVLSVAAGMAISRRKAGGTVLVGSSLGLGGVGTAVAGRQLLPRAPWGPAKERLKKDVDATIDALH